MTTIGKFVLGGVVALVLGYGLHRGFPGARTATEKVRAPEHTEPARSEKVVHEHRVVLERAHLDSAASASVNRNDPEDAPQHEEDPTPEELAAELDLAFESDVPDRTASHTAASITSAFRNPAATGSRLEAVECRSTRCRLKLHFSDDEADKRVLKDFYSLLSGNGVDTRGWGFVVPTREVRADGSVRATVHVFRSEATPPG